MLRRRHLPRVLHCGAAAGVLVTALAGPVSAATTTPPSGGLAVLPATGNERTELTLVTPGGCPAGTNIQAKITGQGFPAAGQNIVGNSPIAAYPRTATGGIRVPLSLILRDIGNLPEVPVHYVGTYRLTVVCRDRVRLPVLAEFSASLEFSSSRTYRAANPSFPVAKAAQDVVPGVVPPAAVPSRPGSPPSRPGHPLAAGPGASSGAPARRAESPLAAASASGSGWLRWAGVGVFGLGGAGLVASVLASTRRRSRSGP